MKKIISFLGILSFIITPLSSLVACQENLDMSNKYFNVDDINKINPLIRNEIKYTSPIAKILIAGRHENANYHAFPAIDYYLHNLDNLSSKNFITKDGDKINVEDYINGYKYYNHDFYNFRDKTYNETGSNDYINMNHIALMDTWDSITKTNDFVSNPNTAWAMYDTGAYASTMAHFSKSVTKYISTLAGDSYWGGNYINGSSSNLLYDNNLTVQGVDTVNKVLSYTDNSESSDPDKVNNFGEAIYPIAEATTNLYSLHDLSTAFQALQTFSTSKFYVLEYLSKLIPFVNTNFSDEPTFTSLLSLPLILANMVIQEMYKEGQTNNLLDFFADNVINPTSPSDPGYIMDKGENKNYNLSNLVSAAAAKAYTALGTQSTTYLDVTGNYKQGQLSNSLLYFYFMIGKWFDKAQLHPNSPQNSLINNNVVQKKFNQTFGKIIAEKIKPFKDIINVFPMSDEAITLINSLFGMINENFDLYDLLLSFAGFANWFYQYSDETQTVTGNDAHSKVIRIVRSHPFTGDISKSTPESLPYQKIINENYGDTGGGQYELGSLFYMMNGWATGKVIDNPKYREDNKKYVAANNFINSMVDPVNGFVGKIMKDANQKMKDSWFDIAFSSKNWHVIGAGKGPDGQQLGPIYNSSYNKLIGVRYELDYFGPKDSSTDVLNHHTCNNINYFSPIGLINQEGKGTANTSVKPWTEEDWQKYDGNGNSYSVYSKEIAYKYVVEFRNIPQQLDNLSPVIKDTAMSYLLTDFKWYYDLNNSGLPNEFC